MKRQLDDDVVRQYLLADDELPAATAWAARRGHRFNCDHEALSAELYMSGPGASERAPAEPYVVRGELCDYRLLPPIWRFVDPRDGRDVGLAGYPRPTGLFTSVLHSNGLICAHWNRLAYADLGGPHGNWGGPTSWEHPSEGTVAITIPEMLRRLAHEIASSAGRMAPLPDR